MKKNKSNLSFYVTVAILVLGIIALVKHFHISDFRIIQDDVLYTCGQPRGMDYSRLLYKYHIGTIVNVRAASEHREQNWYSEEITWVRNNGMQYIEMPIDKNNPIPDQTTQLKFLEIMSNKKNLPVLLHGSGNTARVAMLATMWLVKAQGMSVQDAIVKAEELNKGQLTLSQVEFVKSLKK
jgi:protein tyrosine phosphatase (PTP) superfamily phosphohydrolase (DUF442 family)